MERIEGQHSHDDTYRLAEGKPLATALGVRLLHHSSLGPGS